MDLVYTNDSMSAVGYLDFVGFDLSIGDSGNQVQVKLHSDQKTDLAQGSLVYVPESEYGGIVKSINSKIETDGQRYVYYSGPSWSGRLQERIVKPPSGQDHYTMDGEANDELNRLMEYLDLDYLFEAPDVDSGIELDIDIDRFADGYSALRKVATAYDCRLSMVYSNVSKKVVVQLTKREVHGNTSDSSPISVTVDKPVNHLICAGQGELQDRVVIDLYIGADGSIQKTPYYTGADAIEALYENTSADADKLNEEGTKKLQDLQNVNQVNISVDDSSEDLYPLDDVISGIDPVTGIQASSTIAKKVVSVDYRGFETYRYEAAEVGSTVTTSLSTETSSGGGGGGATYTEGYGINISNNTISADVGPDELEAVQQSVATANLNASNAITAASNATNAATDAANAASSATNAAATAQQTADGKADAVHTHAAADTTSGVFDLDRIPTIPASKLSGTLDIAGGGTGANNAADAANNLEVYYLGVREPIPTNADLNNYKTVGSYASPSNSMAATVINAPMDAPIAFILTVEKTLANGSTANYFRQIFHDRTGKIYTRFIEGDTWSNWIKVATETDLANYLPLTGGTLTGNINTANVNIGSYERDTERLLSVRRGFSLDTDNPIRVNAMVNVGSNMALFSFRDSLNNIKNCLYLYEDRSVLAKPLTVSSGGTGASTAEQARENLGAASEDHTHSYAGSSSVGGAANSAKKLDTPRTITLTGAVNGSASFDGSDDITITTTGDSEAASFLAAHPVKSIYSTSVQENPGVTYGGTWQELPSADSFKYVRTA